MTPFVSTLALVGVVIMVAALLSGFVERVRFPQVALFLALGAVLGPYGLGLVDTGLASPVLETIATISLILVLFMDAVGVTWRDLRGQVRLAAGQLSAISHQHEPHDRLSVFRLTAGG